MRLESEVGWVGDISTDEVVLGERWRDSNIRAKDSLEERLLRAGVEGVPVDMVMSASSRSAVICCITSLSSASCSWCEARSISVSASWARSCSFFLSIASRSFRAAETICFCTCISFTHSSTVD